MPGLPGQKSKTGIYHIIMRGTDRQVIFHGDEDYAKFLKKLFYYKEKIRTEVYAWCFMSNHLHIDVLNRNYAKICSQSINVCINAGRLITLCVVSPQDAKRSSKALEEVLRNFWVEKGAEGVRIESACGSPELCRPSVPYSAILKKNVIGYNEP